MWGRWASLGVITSSLVTALAATSAADSTRPGATSTKSRRCPNEMTLVGGFCVDRWEIHTVDHASGQRLSPYYPPDAKLLAFVHEFWTSEATHVGSARAREFPLPVVPLVQRAKFSPRAVSAPGIEPQGYMSYDTAQLACAQAGKRLCREDEWVRACRSNRGTKHPYGDSFEPGRCNVFRNLHPAHELHGNSSLGHLDPRLHLVWEEGTRPLYEVTGNRARCASQPDDGDIIDLVGNLDEWIDDPNGTFVGGFYSRSTREGCEAKVENHAATYADYSLGTRCCQDAR